MSHSLISYDVNMNGHAFMHVSTFLDFQLRQLLFMILLNVLDKARWVVYRVISRETHAADKLNELGIWVIYMYR